MKPNLLSLFAVFLVLLCAASVFGQETEERVVDEVVAQVNEGVITLSRIKREMKAIIAAEVQQGKSREEAEKRVNERQGELIANLINEELLVQKAKELGLEREIEGNVNQRFLQIMQQYNMKTLDALYTEMRRTGVELDEIRELWRKQATREIVLQQEVQRKVYWEATSKDLKDYFEKNKAKFTKPETVTLSEIFLSFAGNTEAAVREKAARIVKELRAGADFNKMVAENSDREGAAKTNGKVDTFKVSDLEEKFATAIKDVKAGGITEPIEIDQIGLTILRVDERTAASSESQFDESAVRLAILSEKAPEAGKKFMSSLREDSYIKINDTYRPLVAPILFSEERKEKAAN